MIVIPILGHGSRFANAGYRQPKFMLDLHGLAVLEWVFRSFESIRSEVFLVGVRKEHQAKDFVEAVARRAGIEHIQVYEIVQESDGQGESVRLILQAAGQVSGELIIFNCDSVRLGFSRPRWPTGDGYLEVFEGTGDHWSFVEPWPRSRRVQRTAEKQRISALCSNGLYQFADIALFLEALRKWRERGGVGESYVAPLYNELIRTGRSVYCVRLRRDQMIFAGTPAEYEHANSDAAIRAALRSLT